GNGFDIKVYTFDATAAPDNPKLAQIVQAYWAKLGARVDIVATDQAGWTTLRNKPVKDPIVGQAATFGMWTLPPANLSSHWYSKGGNVLLGDAFPEFDKLVDAINTEMDPAKSQEYMAQALKIAADAYTTLNVARFPLVGIAGPRVGKVDFPTPLPLAVLPLHAAYYTHGAVR
ncbi:MAG: hypothetical protein HYY32_06385, partial [Chloroflexi bacterium]|nr:hypothetical protein [Chloroflexota bacterium]